MIPTDDPEVARTEAEREVRRGNFKDAVAIYEALVRAQPGEASLAARLETLREMLQPMELVHPKAAAATGRADGPGDAVHEAEAAANRGDLHGAISLYERLVAERPDNPLFAERLEELRALARDPVQRGAMPRSRPAPPMAPPRVRPSPDPAIPTRWDAASSAPPASDPLPDDPVACLEALLDRVRRHRR